MAKSGTIYSGIGGWTYEPWRGVFYPKGLPQSRELEYAGQRLTSIEVNGTFYSTMKPATFRKWASEVPDGFVFSLKAPRYAVNRKVLAEAGDSIARFIESGIDELGDKLGPLLWQFAPTKKFDAADFGNFLDLLPRALGNRPLRHVLEVRHASFMNPDFIAMARRAGAAIVYTDHAAYPSFADITADFVYARLQNGDESLTAAYPDGVLDAWARRAQVWATGGAPSDLPLVEAKAATVGKVQPRDVFIYFIHEAKLRAPAAAMALIDRLRG